LPQEFDVVCLGGGVAGEALAGELEGSGLSLAVVERQLGGGKFLVGDRFTLADLCYLPFLEFLPLAEIEPPPAVAAWTERLLTRPSALETKPEH